LAFATFLVGGYGLALAALALVVFGAHDSYPFNKCGYTYWACGAWVSVLVCIDGFSSLWTLQRGCENVTGKTDIQRDYCKGQ